MLSFNDGPYEIHHGDCLDILRTMPDQSVNCCVTSPPYFGLRDYGVDGQIGLESTPEAFVAKLVEVFREVRRVLRDDGTLWLNLGDSYANNTNGSNPSRSSCLGSGPNGKSKYRDDCHYVAKQVPVGLKPKDLIGIPWRVAFALQADGWYLRQDIIWHKPNPMPESVRDRCTKAHEYVFLLSKSPRYYFDSEAMKEESVTKPHAPKHRSFDPTSMRRDVTPDNEANERVWAADGKRNRRSVWTVTTKPFKGAHFATFPPKLIEPCILAGCPVDGVVLDPFGGAGTTAVVAIQHQRRAILCELNAKYIEIAKARISKEISNGGLWNAEF